jgi:hypothetical protein
MDLSVDEARAAVELVKRFEIAAKGVDTLLAMLQDEPERAIDKTTADLHEIRDILRKPSRPLKTTDRHNQTRKRAKTAPRASLLLLTAPRSG